MPLFILLVCLLLAAPAAAQPHPNAMATVETAAAAALALARSAVQITCDQFHCREADRVSSESGPPADTFVCAWACVPGRSSDVTHWYRIELKYHRPTFGKWDGSAVVKACFEEKYATTEVVQAGCEPSLK